MNTETSKEIWHVEAGGAVYETSFDEMTSWISEGSLLRMDRVRKGNLRWIEAGKVPSLTAFFNAKDTGEPIRPVVTTTESAPPASGSGSFPEANPTYGRPDQAVPEPVSIPDACCVHTDASAAYICDTCSNAFCKACPNSYGGTVKICPFCGAMCKSLAQMEKIRTEVLQREHVATSGFGFSDFGNALVHPFRFKASLVMGALMFALFSLGQTAFGMGSLVLMASGIFCFLLTNMLTFGVLANTVDNFTQGKLEENFMPSFDDFALWDDVVHPFFLSIGVYISSFGPFIAVMLVAVFMVLGAVKSEMNGLQGDAARTINPQLPYAANASKQSEAVRDLLSNAQDAQKRRVDAIERERDTLEERVASIESGVAPSTTQQAPALSVAAQEERDIEAVQQLIVDQRKAQLESTIGKAPETVAADQEAFFRKLLGYGAIFLVVGGITLLWGFFYFPAACAVAGYTRSFVATINPSVGLDTIRRLGGSYALILLMGFVLLVVSSVIGGILSLIFLPFNMPAVGNIPAKFLSSIVGFYFSVVFSCIIGYALYKAGDRLKLYR